jgi:hypothetical protein
MVVKGTLTIVAICGLVLACTAPASSPDQLLLRRQRR